jgi:hypothetical protein
MARKALYMMNKCAQLVLANSNAGLGGLGGALPTAVGSNASSVWVVVNSTSATSTTIPSQVVLFSGGVGTSYQQQLTPEPLPIDDRNIHIPDGLERVIHMPDGTTIEVSADGSFRIFDQDAKVTYRANRIRDFNRYLNVSDRLEEFIAFCGEHGVRSGEMLKLPIDLFIGWLCIKAAETDQEPVPDIKLLPDLRKQRSPQCHECGKFISPAVKAAHIEFCNPGCFGAYYDRIAEAPQLELACA